MSESVPVSVALIQAAEYLVKLGSNLQKRTENVKAKRLPKDKLKRPHGIQKAVDKILVICELSKQSIVYVENTIMSIMNKPGVLSRDTDAGPSQKLFEFQYQGCLLKISKKIDISRYTSAKVVARKMLLSELEGVKGYIPQRADSEEPGTAHNLASANESLVSSASASKIFSSDELQNGEPLMLPVIDIAGATNKFTPPNTDSEDPSDDIFESAADNLVSANESFLSYSSKEIASDEIPLQEPLVVSAGAIAASTSAATNAIGEEIVAQEVTAANKKKDKVTTAQSSTDEAITVQAAADEHALSPADEITISKASADKVIDLPAAEEITTAKAAPEEVTAQTSSVDGSHTKTKTSAFVLKCVDINKLKSIESTSSEAQVKSPHADKSKDTTSSNKSSKKSHKNNKHKNGVDSSDDKEVEKKRTASNDLAETQNKYWNPTKNRYTTFIPRCCTVRVIREDFSNINFKKTEQQMSLKTDKCQAREPSCENSLRATPSINEKKTKRKSLTEISRAKRMLLTYSSDSESDICLRFSDPEVEEDTNKETKTTVENSLQNDIEKHRKRLLISSSSDDEIGCSVKAGSSGNQSSEDTEKDINGLINIAALHKLSRRRRHSSTTSSSGRADTSRRKFKRKKKMSKAKPVIDSTTLLEADSNSSGESAPAGGDSDLEDLPEVTLTGVNGTGALDQLARNTLLDESDASNSHGSDSEPTAREETVKDEEPTSSEDKSVKSKRRKNAAAILSDSEGGVSKKKGTKDSDFDDSEDDASEPAKKSRKKKIVDSDASAGSSAESGSKKKRRRIKQLDDTDASGSESENEGKKHGRKNIRKVMGKNQLEEATKKAARQEKERIARITERQKLYNNLQFDESGKPDEVVLDKVVLDFDPETKEPLIEVDRGLVKKLKPHQANGIKFMWDACFESVKRIKKDKGSGCILAHCMGLGKTLQVVSLTHTLLTHGDLTGVRRVLVVCPLSTVLNWVNEFKMWLKHAETDEEIVVYELSKNKQNLERAMQLQYWYEEGGVCVLGYEMFRNLSADNSKKYRKKVLKTFQLALVDPGPDLVVCDEGHLLKNEKTSLSQSMNRVKTLRRIVLTGTPLQNNLKEYYCMVQFVKPNLLGKYNEYLNRFVNPITNGQYTDSTEHDIRVMKRRSHVLHKMLDGAVQRRDYGVLAPFLPPKHEYVLFITLSEVQTKLYQHYLDNYSRRPLPGKSSGFLFPDFQSLQRIWTHPLVLKYNSERYEIMQQKKREREEEEDSEGSLADFIDDESTAEETSSEDSMDDNSDASDDSRKKNKKKKASKNKKAKESKASARRGTRANPVEQVDADLELVEVKNENPTEWWMKLVTEEELDDMRNSSKLILLFDILRQCEAIGDKLLVFSQSLYSLDLIEHFLGKVDEATQEGRVDEKLAGHVGSWSPGIDYFRLDGSTSCENRSIWCKNFNREDNPRARLFLISTRAGGLGINLVAANRVVIFDVSWNPSHDVQSIFRVYRFGQKKPCYVYRFLAMGTMEEKIYERQVTKQAISKRVIDEQQIDRHYAENDLAELYKFEPRPPEPRPLPPLPKDRLFAEMLREHEKQIYKYHEHDSLLENKEEETLTEEERKAAWEDFENEKTRPPPAPFANVWPMHNAGLLAQQQHQLAYTALAAVLRKDMPNINDQQIRELLPLVYNANPQLVQKMNDIYKYMPNAMMNPTMMNSGLLNAAVGGAGGMGSSGLQYEPPWQRQQQQQQQMRLQQLMQQQQNQIGAKYYAGGLGSRDPVAMALQQQFARDLGGGGGAGGGTERGAGRPRGRPPLAPRAPPPNPPAPGDVVNLDSD